MLLGWMIYANVVAALLALAAWALERALRLHGVPARWIWAGAMAASLGAAAWTGVGPTPSPEVAPPPAEAAESLAGAQAAAPASPGSVTSASTLDLAARWRVALHPVAPGAEPWVLGGWLAASLALGLLVLRAAFRLRAARRTWTRERVDGTEVLVSDRLGPAVVGLLRPAVVIPRWALSLPPSDRSLILRHEAEHRRAWDLHLLTAALLWVVALPWALPLWWQVWRLRLAVEMDCDHRVLRPHRSRTLRRRYALLLTEMARRGSPAGVSALPLARPAPFLVRRILQMTDTKRPRLVRTAAFALLGGLVVLAACQIDGPTATAPDPASEVVEASVAAEEGKSPMSVEIRAPGGVHRLPSEEAGRPRLLLTEGRVTGLVRSPDTGEGLANVKVMLEPARVRGEHGTQRITVLGPAAVGATTNVQGRVLLTGIPGGTYVLTLGRDDLGTYRIFEVQVADGPGAAPGPEGATRPPPDPPLGVVLTLPGRDLPPPSSGDERASPTGSVIGTVRSADTGDPLGEVQVTVEGTSLGATTDVEGRFLLLSVPSGARTLHFRNPAGALVIVEEAGERRGVDIDLPLGGTVDIGTARLRDGRGRTLTPSSR